MGIFRADFDALFDEASSGKSKEGKLIMINQLNN